MALVTFSSYAHEEPVQDDDQLKKEQIFVQAEDIEEETVIELQDEQLACDCKKRKKGKKEASLRFVSMTSEQNEEGTEETIEDEVIAWSSFNIFIHTATF
jgi:hypothetical protein